MKLEYKILTRREVALYPKKPPYTDEEVFSVNNNLLLEKLSKLSEEGWEFIFIREHDTPIIPFHWDDFYFKRKV